jgi:hypothetical protein
VPTENSIQRFSTQCNIVMFSSPGLRASVSSSSMCLISKDFTPDSILTRDTIDVRLRLSVRALQIALAVARDKDSQFMRSDLDRLLGQAQADARAQGAVLMAAGLLAVRFARKDPIAANRYLLIALRSEPGAKLPDGRSLPIPKETPLEGMLWVTARATNSDAEVEDWLETVGRLSAEGIRVLSESDLAADNSVILCDSIWLREYRSPNRSVSGNERKKR